MCKAGEHAECRSLVPRVSAEIFWREGAIVLVPRLGAADVQPRRSKISGF